MKKITACILAVLMACLAFSPVAMASGEGGIQGFFIGCCFGARSGAAYNDGKKLHWKEWGLLIPFASIVIEILNGVDAMNGLTTADLAGQYGSQYY